MGLQAKLVVSKVEKMVCQTGVSPHPTNSATSKHIWTSYWL